MAMDALVAYLDPARLQVRRAQRARKALRCRGASSLWVCKIRLIDPRRRRRIYYRVYRMVMAEQEIGGQEEKAGVEMPIGERAVTLVAGEGTPKQG